MSSLVLVELGLDCNLIIRVFLILMINEAYGVSDKASASSIRLCLSCNDAGGGRRGVLGKTMYSSTMEIMELGRSPIRT